MTDTSQERQWYSFPDFANLVPGISRRTMLRLADEGKAPPYVRFAPRSVPFWEPSAIDSWVAERLSALNVGGRDHGQ